jgi:hypothetical protein
MHLGGFNCNALRDETSQMLGNAYWQVPIRVAARLLGLWVRILLGSCVFVSYDCCVFSGRVLRVRLITRPEASCRVWDIKRVLSRSPFRGRHDLESDRSATRIKRIGKWKYKICVNWLYPWTGICLETSISMHQQSSITLMMSVPIM